MAVTETDKLGRTNAIDLTNARPIIFDRRWDFNINNLRGYVELRVLESPQSQQCEFCWGVGLAGFIPLQYNIDVSGDNYREFGLPADCKLAVDVANFKISRRQCIFDLLIELKVPVNFVPPAQIFNDTIHCAVPTVNMIEDQLRPQLPNIAQLERALASMSALTSATN